MRDVVNAWVVFFGYAVLAVFAQNAIFTRALGVSRLVQLVGDDRTSSWLFGLQLCITQVLVAPLAWYAGSWIVPLETAPSCARWRMWPPLPWSAPPKSWCSAWAAGCPLRASCCASCPLQP